MLRDVLKGAVVAGASVLFLILSVGLAVAFENENAAVALDLDSAAGDQGVTTRSAPVGEEVMVELYATVIDLKKFDVKIGFDPAKLSFVSGTVESGYQILPPALVAGKTDEVQAVGLRLAGPTSGDPLLLVKLIFKPLEGFEEATLTVIYAEFQSPSGTDKPAQDATATITLGVSGVPMVEEVVIGPSSPRTLEPLVVGYTYTDPDEDAEEGTEIRWIRDGVLVSGYNDSTHVSPDSTAKGQAWYCTIRPKDGTVFGATVSSDTVTIGNSAPSAPVIHISPKPAYAENDLKTTLDVASVDPDGDAVSYRVQWVKDGVAQEELTLGTVSASFTAEGQLWRCVVTPNDGEVDGASASDSVRIRSVPVFEGPLEEQTVVVGHTLTFQVQASDADGDSLWCVADSLPAGATFDETTWTFVWRPEEGQEADDPYRVVFSISDGDTTLQAVVEVYVGMPADALAPELLTGPDALGVTDAEATVSWTTDEEADSWVEYGLDVGYGLEAGRVEWVQAHQVRLTDLHADTLYHFRIRSSDRYGNEMVSGDVTFRTKATPDTTAPRMILAPVVVSRTDAEGTVAWTTNELSDSWVAYGLDATYGMEVGSDVDVTDHRVRLTDLESDTEYHYRVSSTDPSGNRLESGDLTFRTKAAPDTTAPRVLTGPAAVSVDHNSGVIEWTTNELSDSGVEYGLDAEYGYWAGSEEDVRVHQVSLRHLSSSTEYHYRVHSTDPSGNEVIGADRTFWTASEPDRDDPEILTGPAVVAKTHDSGTIVWTTDEPSDSWVDYGESLGYGERQGEGRDVRVHTVVLTNLSAGTRYYYRVSSTDPSGNGPTYQVGEFETEVEADPDPPVILTGPMVYWTDELATVAWGTDEQSTSVVYYGTVETYGTALEEALVGDDSGESYVTDHSVTMVGLVPGERYYYRVESEDLDGNAVVSVAPFGGAKRAKVAKVLQPPGWGGTFTTNLYADTQVPVILSGPGVTFKNDSRVTIGWETDEGSDSVIEYGVFSGGVGKVVVGEAFPHRVEWAQDVSDHEVTLTHLEPGVLVRYRVGSTDPSGNGPVWSGEGVVETDRLRDEEAPSIVWGPEVVLRTDRSVVIGWDTDESGDSVVEYGEDVGYGREWNDMRDVVEHRMTLTRLEPETAYHYRVGSVDPSGNGPVWSGDVVFATQSVPDVVAPEIVSPEVVSRTDRSVVIVWGTNELADSYVEYGEDVSYGFNVGNAEDVTEHRVELTNLKAATEYHYQVGSIDRSGNGPTESSDGTFVTDAGPDEEAPAAPSGLSALREGSRVVLAWTANAEQDVVGYHVYRREGEGVFGVIATLVSGVGYADAGGTSEKAYGYRITAVDGSGNESDPSEEAVPALECPGDFDGDGKVFTEDFVLFVDRFGLKKGDVKYEAKYDLNGDDKVFTEDFVLFVDLFGFMAVAKASGAVPLGMNAGVRVVLDVAEEGSVRAGSDPFGFAQGRRVVLVSEGAETVVLDVYAEGVTALKGYGMTLRYDPRVLSFVGAEPENGEGVENLLNREGGKSPLFLVVEDGEELGRIWVANSLRGPTSVAGDGLLAHLRFEVISALKGSFVVRVEAVDLLDGELHWNGVENLRELEVRVVPQVYALGQNFPNPFNSVTRLSYQLPRAGKMELSIYNVLGQKVRTLVDARQGAGFYEVRWDGRDGLGREVGSGIYLIRVVAGDFVKVRKMALMK